MKITNHLSTRPLEGPMALFLYPLGRLLEANYEMVIFHVENWWLNWIIPSDVEGCRVMKCQKHDRTYPNWCGIAIWLCRDDLLPVRIVLNPLSLRLLFIMRRREKRFSGCFHILIDLHQPVGTNNLLEGNSRANLSIIRDIYQSPFADAFTSHAFERSGICVCHAHFSDWSSFAMLVKVFDDWGRPLTRRIWAFVEYNSYIMAARLQHSTALPPLVPPNFQIFTPEFLNFYSYSWRRRVQLWV